MDWLRLYTDILDDPKMAALSDAAYRTYTLLLLLCRERDTVGVLDLSLRDIAWRLRRPVPVIQRVVGELLRLDILIGEGTIQNPYLFKNWTKRQFQSDDAAGRKRQYRQNRRTGQHRDSARDTGGTCPVPDTDTDTDTDTEASNKLLAQAPVDNSVPEECPPFPSTEPVEVEKEKVALKEKPKRAEDQGGREEKTELQTLINQVKVKHPKLAIETWYGKNIGVREDAVIHVLKSLLKNGDGAEYPYAYLQAALNVEIGKYNARDFDAEEKRKAKVRQGGISTIGDLVGEFARQGG